MGWLLILRTLSAFFAKNWKAVAVALATGALVWIVCDWRAQADEIVTLRHEKEAAEVQARTWRGTSRLQTDRALEAARMREAAEAALAELLARPPQIITIIQDAASGVAGAVPDDAPCEEAVRSLAEYLQGVPR